MGARVDTRLFDSWHNAEDWGPLRAEAGELVSVPDLVRWHTLAPLLLPLVPAVDRVLGAIERDGSIKGYMTRRGHWATAIRDDLVWPDKMSELFWDSGTSLFFDPGGARKGALGLIDCTREHWTAEGRSRALYHPISLSRRQFAIHRNDAERLFGYLLANSDSLEQIHPPAPAAVQSEPSPAPAVDLKPTKKPGDDWTPADYAELLRQYESLTTGKGAMKGESAREALGKAWSYAPNSIKPFLTTARKLRTPTT